MSPDELKALGHSPMSPTQAIRAHCLDCCGGSAHEVSLCAARRCPSWPFRLGTNPWRTPMSEDRRETLRQQALERGFGASRISRGLISSDEEPGADVD